MKALNFYSSVYHGFLVSRDKTCTIRLGDKREKYQEGDIVLVTYGDRFKKRKRVFTAIIDRVVAKPVQELSQDELQGENPEMRTPSDAVEILKSIYTESISLDTLVSVVHFSEIAD